MPGNKEEVKIRAYRYSVKLIRFLAALPDSQVYRIIKDQLLRSGTSIGANIIEAQAASSKKDFIKFYEISLKSANETLYWLGILRDATETDKAKANEFLEETKIICKILGASLITLKGKRKL